MAPIEITTKRQAIELLRAAVEQKGEDYVDPRAADFDNCSYAVGRRPGCLIGHALYFAGVSVSMLHQLDQLPMPGMAKPRPTYEYSEAWAVGYLREHGVVISHRALRVFAAAQREQDMMKTWGEALRQAKQVKVTAPPVE